MQLYCYIFSTVHDTVLLCASTLSQIMPKHSSGVRRDDGPFPKGCLDLVMLFWRDFRCLATSCTMLAGSKPRAWLCALVCFIF